MIFQKTLIYFFLMIYSIFSAVTGCAREFSVRNVRFEDRGQVILIQYDLNGQLDKKYKISLALSDNNGNTFRIKPESIKGHIGSKIKPGKNKRITWYIKKDYPAGLKGSEFVFAVDAELQKGLRKWPVVLAGTIIVVSGAAYLFSKAKSKKPTTGSIIIDIPVN